MVAVGAGGGSASLVRWAAPAGLQPGGALAGGACQNSASVQAENRERLARTLALARRMGAEVITIASDNVVDALLGLARERNVTQLLIGKSPGASWWRLLSGGTLVANFCAMGATSVYLCAGRRGGPTLAPAPVVGPGRSEDHQQLA